MTILDTLAEKSKVRAEEARQKKPISILKGQAEAVAELRRRIGRENFLEESLRDGPIHVIAELKKASPSKGLISEDFDYPAILRSYEQAGASAISCLTEPEYFLGSLEILRDVRNRTDLPLLRKDFTVDVYQIYEAAAAGADAVLLICAILNDDELKDMIKVARELGLSALVETHDEAEVRRALDAGATLIGVNNRDLKDFSVDLGRAEALAPMIRDQAVFVAESGIKSADDVKRLSKSGANAVLIGETLMKSGNVQAFFDELASDVPEEKSDPGYEDAV